MERQKQFSPSPTQAPSLPHSWPWKLLQAANPGWWQGQLENRSRQRSCTAIINTKHVQIKYSVNDLEINSRASPPIFNVRCDLRKRASWNWDLWSVRCPNSLTLGGFKNNKSSKAIVATQYLRPLSGLQLLEERRLLAASTNKTIAGSSKRDKFVGRHKSWFFNLVHDEDKLIHRSTDAKALTDVILQPTRNSDKSTAK